LLRSRLGIAAVIAALMLAHAPAQTAPNNNDPYCGPRARCWGQRPLPQDAGYSALWQDLIKLRTTARLMATAAHPDDEDVGMLTLQARGRGAVALELTITRGEGGQNRTGAELFDELGILRTLELLQADAYYGADERFTRAVDFGFSKSPEETFEKWGGHDVVLADMVRVIRTFRPDVLMANFSGTASDGHGHHQASGILTREAFRAAGDPQRFPDQIKEGLPAWQPKKLYMGRVRRGSGGNEATARLEVGAYNPILGMSYDQFGLVGRAQQVSQVLGANLPPGRRANEFRLVDSVLPEGVKPGTQENDFFDGLDTSLPGLAARLGSEERNVPFLATALDQLDKDAQAATAAALPNQMDRAAPPLLHGIAILRELLPKIEAANLTATHKLELLTHLRSKLEQFEQAAADALALEVTGTVDPLRGPAQPSPFQPAQSSLMMAYPGLTFTLTTHLYNRSSQPLTNAELALETPPGWQVEQVSAKPGAVEPNGEAAAQFRVTVAANAEDTRPWFFHTDPETESIYKVVPELARYVTTPFPPPPLWIRARYSVGNSAAELRSVAQVRFIDPTYGQAQRPLAVGPPLSVEVDPPTQVVSTAAGSKTLVRVGVRNNVNGTVNAALRLALPPGWRAEPASGAVHFTAAGEYENFLFTVTPGRLTEQRYDVGAVVDYNGKQYAEGYRVVTRHELGTFYFYRPSRQSVSAVEVKLPPRLRVGYIMGAGDDIPPVLEQLGLTVQMISPAELAAGDLSRYDTIVVGIRAYDVRTDVREHNRRLLDYVQRGGTLVVQYNQQIAQFNAGHYTPFAATASSERVTLEDAPVDMLAPGDPAFNFPNKITARDFAGWVQERGLYFMSDWAPQFTPLLASRDPGEQMLRGGLLAAKYGKGTYIYCAYAFFRQLPAGVPGAARLFVNLLSMGHEAASGSNAKTNP
jgi:LmbE family N-acetylglucosaminyl deacetylase